MDIVTEKMKIKDRENEKKKKKIPAAEMVNINSTVIFVSSAEQMKHIAHYRLAFAIAKRMRDIQETKTRKKDCGRRWWGPILSKAVRTAKMKIIQFDGHKKRVCHQTP